jgi:hypothetical protein
VTARYTTTAELQRNLTTEILVALGLPRSGWTQTLLSPLVWPVAHRAARMAAEFDQRVALEGWTAACRWALARFVDGFQALGTEQLPASGPLVIAANHPGSYDALVISSALARDDLKILVSDVPVFRSLYATSAHFIYTETGPGSDTGARMPAAREAVRHLRAGGAILVYPSAQVDPDPAFLPGAEEELETWSSSLSLFLRRVPETQLVVAIVRGVLDPVTFRHPLTRIRREQRLKQFLAEFIQVGQQVLLGRRYNLTPVVRFGEPLTAAALAGGDARTVILARARDLLKQGVASS